MHSLSIVIPAFHEEDRLPETLAALKQLHEGNALPFFLKEIFVIDDGSRDRTLQVAQEMSREWPELHVLALPKNQGKGAAVKEGLSKARSEWILVADADMATPWREIDKLAQYTEQADLIMGSRALPTSHISNHQPWFRQTMGKIFNKLIRICTGLSYVDTQCGFKILRNNEVLQEKILPNMKIKRFAWDVELILLMEKHGQQILEIPVEWSHKDLSHVHPVKDGFDMFFSLIKTSNNFRPASRINTLILLVIAFAVAMLHMLTNQRYGFTADEFQFLSDATHLDWGFVPYPPFTAFIGHVGLSLFGLSLVGLRLFAVVAQAIVIVVAGLMARELGGGRLAQVTAALAVAFSPIALSQGTMLDYTGFDLLWWVLAGYFTLRLLKSQNPRWWLAIGLTIGFGLETKYTMVFFIAGLLGGMALTSARRYFLSPWFWAGVAVAWAIFLPNFLWQVSHDFITYHFLQAIHNRDAYHLHLADSFIRDQFILCINTFAAPLMLAGLFFLLRDQRYRMLAWMSVIPVGLFWISKGRGYYASGAYPLLIAMGSVIGERWLNQPLSLQTYRYIRLAIAIAFFTIFLISVTSICTVIALATAGPQRDFTLGKYDDEIDWDNKLVHTVANVANTLPAGTNFGILTTQYGQQGAIELHGPAYHLPTPIGLINTAWLRGYPNPPPTTLIVVGLDHSTVNSLFTDCYLAAIYKSAINAKHTAFSDVFVCGSPREPWSDFWMKNMHFD